MIYFIVIILIISNLYFIKKSYEFGKSILEVQDALEESLNVLNARVESINKVLEIPLFFDSPEIRRVHEDIRVVRDSIKNVAETFSIIENEKEENENDDR